MGKHVTLTRVKCRLVGRSRVPEARREPSKHPGDGGHSPLSGLFLCGPSFSRRVTSCQGALSTRTSIIQLATFGRYISEPATGGWTSSKGEGNKTLGSRTGGVGWCGVRRAAKSRQDARLALGTQPVLNDEELRTERTAVASGNEENRESRPGSTDDWHSAGGDASARNGRESRPQS